MQRTLFVHIGLARTGTTSIQNMLDQRRVALRRSGVCLPVSGRMLGRSFLDGDCNWAGFLNELRSSRAPRVVVSNESWTAEERSSEYWARRFAAVAERSDIDVKVVGYVRPQHQLLESLYAQAVKVGRETAPFQKAFDARVKFPRLDYHRPFRSWREVFGDRLSVYSMESTRVSDVVAHFLDVIGVDDVGRAATADPPRMNQRLGAKHLEVLRLVSAARAPDASRREVRCLLEPVRRGLAPLLEGDVPFTGLSPAQVRAVMKLFADSNARFAREYGIDAGGVLFREPIDAHVRPACAKWADLSEAERKRVRRFVRDATGVDLAASRHHVVPTPSQVMIARCADRRRPARASIKWVVDKLARVCSRFAV